MGLAHGNGFAGQHELHGGPHACDPDRAHGAPETGMDAQLYLRQAENRLLMLDGDSIVAGHRQFEAAAEREAVDRRNGWAGQRFQAIEDLLAEPDERVGLLGVLDGGELVDIGPHHEAVPFTRMDDHAGRRPRF